MLYTDIAKFREIVFICTFSLFVGTKFLWKCNRYNFNKYSLNSYNKTWGCIFVGKGYPLKPQLTIMIPHKCWHIKACKLR